MSFPLDWQDAALRLLAAVVAGAALGFNRGEHGRAAGLRTTTLVCVAACASMIQVNLMLGMSGRPSSSFVMLDLMRLPLGILSGMGFIGGGAILRRGNLVLGVTTAATLWFVTMMGLCFGGGQMVLGLEMLGLGLVVLEGMKWLEDRTARSRHGSLAVCLAVDGPREEEIRAALTKAGYRIAACAVRYKPKAERRHLQYELDWRSVEASISPPAVVDELSLRSGVLSIRWQPDTVVRAE